MRKPLPQKIHCHSINVELRDAQGNVIQTQTTGGSGLYTFSPSNPNTPYFVNVAVARTQVAAPMKSRAVINSPTYYDLYLKNVPATHDLSARLTPPTCHGVPRFDYHLFLYRGYSSDDRYEFVFPRRGVDQDHRADGSDGYPGALWDLLHQMLDASTLPQWTGVLNIDRQ